MAGDYCLPEESIHGCVCTHSHLYSYIYGPVALLDNIQSSFSGITISTPSFNGDHRDVGRTPSIDCKVTVACEITVIVVIGSRIWG
jgi:hypothetical protein